MDGFDQAEASGEGDEGEEVRLRLLAAQGDALEALELADGLLDAGAAPVERLGEEARPVLGGALVRDDGGDAALAAEGSIVVAVEALVRHRRARIAGRTEVEQHREMGAVGGLAAGQIEGEDVAVEVGLEMDLGGEAAARAAERLALLPPFAPAAETWARTTVESNICTSWAVSLPAASVSKKASKTPARLSRQKRFQTLFQLPNSPGSARQLML